MYEKCDKCGFTYNAHDRNSYFYNNIDKRTYCKDCKEFRIKSAWDNNIESKETFEDFIENSRQWHQKQLEEKNNEILKLQLELKNKEIEILSLKLKNLEAKLENQLIEKIEI